MSFTAEEKQRIQDQKTALEGSTAASKDAFDALLRSMEDDSALPTGSYVDAMKIMVRPFNSMTQVLALIGVSAVQDKRFGQDRNTKEQVLSDMKVAGIQYFSLLEQFIRTIPALWDENIDEVRQVLSDTKAEAAGWADSINNYYNWFRASFEPQRPGSLPAQPTYAKQILENQAKIIKGLESLGATFE